MSEFPGTSGHMLSDNHVKTDILPHNSYSAAEVQHLASYHLRETKPMSFFQLIIISSISLSYTINQIVAIELHRI